MALPAELETLLVASEDCEKLCKIFEMHQSCDLETLDKYVCNSPQLEFEL